MITWECDYPHSDTTWPKAPEILGRCLEGIPDAEIEKITHLNAMRHFHFDPFKHIPKEECTVGALRAQATDVDLTPLVGGGGNPAELEPGQVITTADIMRQIAPAFAND
jgi:hypothetical protein